MLYVHLIILLTCMRTIICMCACFYVSMFMAVWVCIVCVLHICMYMTLFQLVLRVMSINILLLAKLNSLKIEHCLLGNEICCKCCMQSIYST